MQCENRSRYVGARLRTNLGALPRGFLGWTISNLKHAFGLYVLASFLFNAVAVGDVITTADGSRLVGTIERVEGGKLTLVTEIAGTLVIEVAKVTSIESTGPMNVELNSGDRLIGAVAAGDSGSVVKTAVGDLNVGISQIQSVWPEGADSPEVIAERKRSEEEIAAYKPKWGLTIEGGARRTEGNTDTMSANGKFEIRRKTKADLLKMYVAANYEEENKQRTENEYRGGAIYENNITDRWYWYARTELEHDEFENLDLRTTIAAGLGYYWIKKDEHELKTRTGIGYRHETYMDDGGNEDDVVADLGLDYRVDIAPWLQFVQSTTYTPSLEYFSRYRIDADTAFSFPLKKDEWRLKLGMRNEYNSRPDSGRDRLDNTYYANIAMDLKWE